MTTSCPRFRFAPSPNGFLHLGHAYSALQTWSLAERFGGEVLLRIEDIDTGRTREHFVDAILEDLAWLGLTWAEPVRRQSEHFADYRRASDTLCVAGLLYACTATRKQIAAAVAGERDWPLDPDGAPHYPGLSRVVARDAADTVVAHGTSVPVSSGTGSSGTGAALRIDISRAIAQAKAPLIVTSFDADGTERTRPARPEVWGDAVIVRKDTPTSYHLSVVVDDALQGIAHVSRGRDLEAATDLHVLLQDLLGLPTPAYHHHALITDSAGRKLSKSFRDTSLRQLRNDGWTPEDVRTAVGLT